MISLSIGGIDVFDHSNRYFDIIVTEEIRINSSYAESRPIDMMGCEKKSFQEFGEEFGKIYDNLSLNNSLCFPENFTGTLSGKWAS